MPRKQPTNAATQTSVADEVRPPRSPEEVLPALPAAQTSVAAAQTSVAHQPNQPGIMHLIELALSKELDVSVLERLMAMEKEHNARQALTALNQALQAFKAECPVIVKKKKGAKAKYAPLEDIEEIIKPLLVKHQLCYDYDIATYETYLEAFCTVTHVLGASKRRSSGPIPYLEPISNRQGGTAMNLTQASAGTSTMATRYALRHALGLVFADEDTDGATVYIPPTSSQLAELRSLIVQTKYAEWKWVSTYNSDLSAPEEEKLRSAEQLSTSQVAALIAKITQYLTRETRS